MEEMEIFQTKKDHAHIKFPDGRTKTVSLEHLEPLKLVVTFAYFGSMINNLSVTSVDIC